MGAERFVVHETYSRADVAKAYGEGDGQGGKWMSGVVPVGNNDLALFVTLDKSEYSGHHRYEDAFESKTMLRWKSQTRASPDNAWGEKHLQAGNEKPHHLFVRTEKGNDFVYCGEVEYQEHKGSKPMTIWFQLQEPLRDDIYTDFHEATNHAGGLEAPAYIKSKQLDLKPAAADLRAVPSEDTPDVTELDNSPYEWENSPWGWATPSDAFLDAVPAEIMDALVDHHDRRFDNLALSDSQREAWRETIRRFQDWLGPLTDVPGGEESLVVLEYELPGEGGRRPDVVIVTPSHHVFVIECKNKSYGSIPDLDEALRYKHDLEAYHSETHGQPVTAILALLDDDTTIADTADEYPVQVLTPATDSVTAFQEAVIKTLEDEQPYHPEQWLLGEYSPLPHLMEAVITTFEDRPLPRLKFVQSSNVPDAVETITDLAEHAKANQEHILVLITGVPGSGKTLVGIESCITAQKNGVDSHFLSGNGPLVAVLQDALDRAGAQGAAKGLVRPMYKFKKSVIANEHAAPADLYVFDEGQRAWQADRNEDYDGSEIELLADVAARQEWSVIVGLIGEGQRIYKGESGTLSDWIDDFRSQIGANWRIMAPDRDPVAGDSSIEVRECLHLDVDIRAKSAHHLHEWVDAVLSGDEASAADLAYQLQESGYPLHITSSREAAEEYVTQLYVDAPDPRYGWVISSAHRQGDDPEGMTAPYVKTHEFKDVWGPWFNAPPEDPASCCQLETPCPEFGCQGLELDFSLVFWGDDLQWRNSSWCVRNDARSWSDESREHTLNTYRVLLTRGREGVVIRCHDDTTRHFLERCGAMLLDED